MYLKLFKYTITFLLFFKTMSSVLAQEEDLICKVTEVLKGDIIKVKIQDKDVRVELKDIGCFSYDHPFGKKAKKITTKMCLGKVVKVKVIRKEYSMAFGPGSIRPHQNLSSPKNKSIIPRDKVPTRSVRRKKKNISPKNEKEIKEVKSTNLVLSIIVAEDILYNNKSLVQELIQAGLAWCSQNGLENKKLVQLAIEAQSRRQGFWAISDRCQSLLPPQFDFRPIPKGLKYWKFPGHFSCCKQVHFREKPKIVPQNEIETIAKKYNFYHSWYNTPQLGFVNLFEKQTIKGDDVVFDHTSNLM